MFIGVIIGSIATYSLVPSTPPARFSKIVEPELYDVPEISGTEAEVLREDRYAAITSIEDVLALPTDFAETEALYVIAGRADSGEVQNLLYQAAGIRNRGDRAAALRILFLRLTELDPRSALAITRTPTFANDKKAEDFVWAAWGKLNFDAALRAAREGNSKQKNVAAQSLYKSIRGPNDEKSRLIYSTLGVRPGRDAQGQYLYGLADESPAAAIKYIESLDSPAAQREQFTWLAHHLNRSGQAAQTNLGELIQSAANQRAFEQSMISYGSQSDPESALRIALAQPSNEQSRRQAQAALQQLASQDPDKALKYLDQFPDQSTRRNVMLAVASGLAQKSPERAIAWVRENDKSGDQMILMAVVNQIAHIDPLLALAEAQNMQNGQMRDQLIGSVVAVLAQSDPAQAVQTIELISDPQSRQTAISTIAASWAQTDFDGAVEWISSLDKNERHRALQQVGQNLVHRDIDRAIRLLDRYPSDVGESLKLQIAQNLARQRSVDAAQSFVARFRGAPDYSRLQAAVASSVASTDPSRAMRMAREIEDGRARDQLYATIVGQQAARDPQQALLWLESISSEKSRAQAVGHIARVWYSQNPAAADAWIQGLPRGAERDSAIVAIVSMRPESVAGTQQLIASIDDTTKRKSAKLAHIRSLVRSDPDEARRLLRDDELSDEDRDQYERILDGSAYSPKIRMDR